MADSPEKEPRHTSPPPLPAHDGHRRPIGPLVIAVAIVVAFILLLALLWPDGQTQPIDEGSGTSGKSESHQNGRQAGSGETGSAKDIRRDGGEANSPHPKSSDSDSTGEMVRADQPSEETSNGSSRPKEKSDQNDSSDEPHDPSLANAANATEEATELDSPSGTFLTLGGAGGRSKRSQTSDESDLTATPSISNALSGRSAGAREGMLQAQGGTAITEAAVKMGLEWLAKNQQENGLWNLTGPYDGGSRAENTAAATAMALLAFQGAGHTHQGDRDEPFTQVVARGSRALLKHIFDNQDLNNNLGQGGGYTQAMCTIAICELYGMTHDRKFRKPALQAVEYCLDAQSPQGGWRYIPRQDSDTSVTGWFVMALQSARMSGLKVPHETLKSASLYLNEAGNEYGTRYSYQPGLIATPSMTAEALLCRQYLGWQHDNPRLQDGTQYLLSHLPDRQSRDVYYWYYATQVCHHTGGNTWQEWNNVMRELLPSLQVKEGNERGSWDPRGDRYGFPGGRLYVTCMSLYVLEVYYRHLPLYQETAVTGNP